MSRARLWGASRPADVFARRRGCRHEGFRLPPSTLYTRVLALKDGLVPVRQTRCERTSTVSTSSTDRPFGVALAWSGSRMAFNVENMFDTQPPHRGPARTVRRRPGGRDHQGLGLRRRGRRGRRALPSPSCATGDASTSTPTGRATTRDACAAELSCILAVSLRNASGFMTFAITLRDRLPKVAALFLDGRISARTAGTIAWRTHLVVDAADLEAIDTDIAGAASRWGRLSKGGRRHRRREVAAGRGPGPRCIGCGPASGVASSPWRHRRHHRHHHCLRPTLEGRCRPARRSHHRAGPSNSRSSANKKLHHPRPAPRRLPGRARHQGQPGSFRAAAGRTPPPVAGDPDPIAARFVVHVLAEGDTIDTPPDPDWDGGPDFDAAEPDSRTRRHQSRRRLAALA